MENLSIFLFQKLKVLHIWGYFSEIWKDILF